MENSQRNSTPSGVIPARPVFSWRKIFLLLLALATALYAVSAWQGAGPRDPRFKGRRLSAWLNDMGHGSGTFALTHDDFRAMDPDGLIWLAWAAEHGHLPPAVNRYAAPRSPAAQWVHECWTRLLHPRVDEWFNERNAALIVLGRFGPDAAPAIPALVRLCNDRSGLGTEWAAKALVAIGPAAWPALEDTFRTSPPGGRQSLVYAVRAQMHESVPPLNDAEMARDLDFIVRACGDPDVEVRSWATMTLQKTGGNTVEPRIAATAIPLLISLLTDTAQKVQNRASVALACCGPEHAAAVPRLIELLGDPDAAVRVNAAWVLGNIDRVEKHSKARLQELTNDPVQEVSAMAKNSLLYIELPPDQRLGR
jgi:hypothetical protein